MVAHPMIPVPQAIDIVLRQAIKAVASHDNGDIYSEFDKEHGACIKVHGEGAIAQNDIEGKGYGNKRYKMVPIDAPPQDIIGMRIAKDIVAPPPGFPPFNASIMDGYAVVSAESLGFIKEREARVASSHNEEKITERSIWTHQVVGSVYAGPYNSADVVHASAESSTSSPIPLNLPHAMYITTGAVVPKPFDCVIPIEQIVESDDKTKICVKFRSEGEAQTNDMYKSMKWIRPVGCDIAPNSVVVPKGQILTETELGIMICCGIRHVPVQVPVKVGVLSTGNEISSLTTIAQPSSSSYATPPPPLEHGTIFDVNRPVLLSLLHKYHAKGIDYGIVSDDASKLKQTIRRALDECDIVITSGGISMGEKDLLERVMTEHLGATIHFGRIHMKPGKPTTLFTWEPPSDPASNSGNSNYPCRTKLLFALPGNPVSATVCFQLLVRPALNVMNSPSPGSPTSSNTDDNKITTGRLDEMVRMSIVPTEVEVVLTHNIKLDKERPEYHRVSLTWDYINHCFMATSTGVQRSSRFESMQFADGVLVLPQATVGVDDQCYKGEIHLCLLFDDHAIHKVGGGLTWKMSHHRKFFQQKMQQPRPTPEHHLTTHHNDHSHTSGHSTHEHTQIHSHEHSHGHAHGHHEDLRVNAAVFGVYLQDGENGATTQLENVKRSVGSHFPVQMVELFSSVDDLVEGLLSSKLNSATTDDENRTSIIPHKLIVIVSNGGYALDLDVSCRISGLLEKSADAMAMTARRAISTRKANSIDNKNRTLALFEVVAGLRKGRFIVLLPLDGVQEGLASLKQLICHAIGVAEGR